MKLVAGFVAGLVRVVPARTVRALIWRVNILRRAVTLGVRIVVEDGQGRVLLVRHTYVPGWHFPGGAVDPGESAATAALRELHEETGVVATDRPMLFGLYRNIAGAGRDHVALFSVKTLEPFSDHPANTEIAESGFFSREALPAGVTQSTQARLAELSGEKSLSDTW